MKKSFLFLPSFELFLAVFLGLVLLVIPAVTKVSARDSAAKRAVTTQAATCSKPWLWNWCRDACPAAKECRQGVIDYWGNRREECERDPNRAKEAIERACESCNKVCKAQARL
jgi:hypothetical protein